jgi:uncharacterized protein (TIGR03084 family)
LQQICTDLRNECEWLDNLVAPLGEVRWNLITPFMGWSIKTEIAHLAYFDSTARLAATDPKAFKKYLEQVFRSPEKYEQSQQKIRRQAPGEVLDFWRRNRNALLDTLLALHPKDRLPWYGPPMSALSFATARLMETWAHGQDVADTLGTERTPTNRLRHIAHLGVSTFTCCKRDRRYEISL